MDDGDLYTLVGNDSTIGVGKVLQGNIRGGIRWFEEAISRREREGYRTAADWCRLLLSEVFLQIIAGKEKPPFIVLLKNLPTLVNVIVTASTRIPALMKNAMDNPHLDPRGYHVGHAEMMLGLVYKIKKRRDQAVQHLTEARSILSQFGETPMLARLDAALAELER